jgi:hypothetical protein
VSANTTLSALTVSGNTTLGNTTLSTLTVSGQAKITQLCENMYNTGTLSSSTASLVWTNGSIFYMTPMSTSNLTVAITSVPTTSSYISYDFSIVINTATYKVYCTSLTVNGSGVTLIFNNGSSNTSVASATVVVQNFMIIFTSSSSTPFKCLTSVSQYY